ncbi:MAG: magnesium transporter [Candidatus Saccharimonadales bacterium]
MSNLQQSYPFQTAGAICETSLAVLPLGTSLNEVRKFLHDNGDSLATADYVYAVDSDGRLMGLVSLRQVFMHDATILIDDLLEREVISIAPRADQEHLVRLALKHELKSVPVVERGILIGVVPPHKILKILHDENVEDLVKEAGLVQRSLISGKSLGIQIRGRLPWLLYGTFGGLLAAGVVQSFERALTEELLLAAFIPTIVYLAGAVGNQVQTIYVRAYAFGLSRSLGTSIRRELSVASIIGVLISLVLAATIMAWLSQPVLALIVSTAALISIIFAGLVSVIMPWLFIKLHYDPAVASGPLGTIVLDVSSILVYFSVAQYILHYIG